MMKPITIIAACDGFWGIGRNGDIPWRCREDLVRFRERTMGSVVVMGVKTVASLPMGLPGRTVVTVSASGRGDHRSVREACLSAVESPEVFIAGGAGVYREAMEFASSAEITRVSGIWNCDVSMPSLDKAGWKLADRRPLSDAASLELWLPPKRKDEA